VAAQQLTDQGFKEVINLSGGIKAWNGFEAIGREDQGLQLFENLDSAEEILMTAYSLEEGLQDFYLRMMQEVTSPEVIKLFRKLADIEDVHKEKIFDEYSRVTGSNDRLVFEQSLKKEALEGGMTTEEYLERFTPDFEKPAEVISLAMTIEAQALDLYTRAGRNSKDPDNQEMLERIAKEEKFHLEQLGSLLDNILEAQ
jgi:rubrerythrin